MEELTPQPLVTVIAVCYNHSAYLTECLDSIKAQTLNDYELLIFDDCSSDDSVEVINSWVQDKQFPCRVVAHQQNAGLCKTLNEAVGLARGRYLCIVATDDVWEPDKLAIQTELLESRGPNTAVAFADAYTMSDDGTLRPGAINDYYRNLWGEIPQGDVYEKLFVGCFVPAPTAMIRRAAFDQVGVYDEELAYEDWDMWLRLAQQFEFAYTDQKLARYRVLETSLHVTLLERKTIGKHRTRLLVRAKHVQNPRLSKETRDLVRAGMRKDAEALYELADPDARKHLRATFAVAPSIRLLILLLYALRKKPYNVFQKVEATYKKYASYARWKFAKIARGG